MLLVKTVEWERPEMTDIQGFPTQRRNYKGTLPIHGLRSEQYLPVQWV